MNDTWLDFMTASTIGVIVWLFGGLDTSLKVLIAFSVIDYLSGVSAAWVKGVVSSRIGFQGIVKKVIMFSLVAVANLIDKLLPGGSDAVRTVVILAFVANEGISIMENADRLGVPFPKALREYFEQMRDKETLKGGEKDGSDVTGEETECLHIAQSRERQHREPDPQEDHDTDAEP